MAASTAIRSLPTRTRPAEAARVCLDRLHSVARSTESTLSPSVWKRFMGGASKDHKRAVVASSMEETRMLRSLLSETRTVAFSSPDGSLSALLGSIDRIIKAMDAWRDAAVEFQEAAFGSEEELLRLTRKLSALCADLRNPASGIA